MPKTRTAIPNRKEARVIVTSEDLLSVYMQYCCQRNSFCTVNYSAIVLNCLGRFLALSLGPDRGCGETSGGKGGKHALHGVGLWEALFGWPPFLTSDNEYYVNYRAGKENWPGPR